MDYGIDGNAGLVLASSRGLGNASATALAKEGVDVVVNGRNEETLEDAVAKLREVGHGKVVGAIGNVTVPSDIETLVETTVSEFGDINHLVTSAGGPPRKRFESVSDDEWYAANGLLVMSVVRSIRASLPQLRESNGTIVNITSRRTKEATPSSVLLSAVRMARPGLMRSLSGDSRPRFESILSVQGRSKPAGTTPRAGSENDSLFLSTELESRASSVMS